MVLTRPIAGQEASAEAFGQPVYDMIQPTPWVNMALVNTWAYFAGGQPAQYRKIGDIVYIRAMVCNGASGMLLFTMPAGFRPPYTIQLAFVTYSGGVFPGLLDITPAGLMTPYLSNVLQVSIFGSYSTTT